MWRLFSTFFTGTNKLVLIIWGNRKFHKQALDLTRGVKNYNTHTKNVPKKMNQIIQILFSVKFYLNKKWRHTDTDTCTHVWLDFMFELYSNVHKCIDLPKVLLVVQHITCTCMGMERIVFWAWAFSILAWTFEARQGRNSLLSPSRWRSKRLKKVSQTETNWFITFSLSPSNFWNKSQIGSNKILLSLVMAASRNSKCTNSIRQITSSLISINLLWITIWFSQGGS